MNRIPLETTIAGAYRFLFTKIVSIVGTLWLPFVLMAAIMGGAVYLVVPHEWLLGHFPTLHAKDVTPQAVFAMIGPCLAMAPLFFVVAIIAVSMMIAGLMRHALGQKTSMTFVYFSLGANVWRMAGAFILCWLVVMFAGALLAGACAAFYALAFAAIPKPWNGLVLAVFILCAVCAWVYTAIRLTFFIPAVVVAENRIGLGRSWQLGGGNFWRIFVIYLLIIMPVAFVGGIIAQMTFLPIVMGHLAQMHATDAHGPEAARAFIHTLLPLIPVIVVINLLERIALMGLMAGAAGTAYNAVTAKAEEHA
ncbi:MAG: hypothetical protein KGJ78_15085 [Alphaproteobacteria bacterium]|nr:hypothetical protein [Alphaproteobacteria bacterium]